MDPIQYPISKANQAGKRQCHNLYLYFLPCPQSRPTPKLQFCLQTTIVDGGLTQPR